MALSFIGADLNPTREPTILSRHRYFLNAEHTRVVVDGHEDARFLWCPLGREMKVSDAKRFGLPEYDDYMASIVPADEVMPEVVEEPKASAPAEDKSAEPSENKASADGKEECPTCEKRFKNLGRHKCRGKK